MKDKKYFSINLYKTLQESKMNYERFAFLIGVSTRTVYEYLSSKKYPSLETIIKIANVLDKSIDELLSKEDKKNK